VPQSGPQQQQTQTRQPMTVQMSSGGQAIMMPYGQNPQFVNHHQYFAQGPHPGSEYAVQYGGPGHQQQSSFIYQNNQYAAYAPSPNMNAAQMQQINSHTQQQHPQSQSNANVGANPGVIMTIPAQTGLVLNRYVNK
jgi:hypothetical protein